MIAVCELNCKNTSHETPNLGFIYGLLLAYPTEPILFFAHSSHWDVLKKNANEKSLDTAKVLFQPIIPYPKTSPLALLWNFFLIAYIFYRIRSLEARAVLFLSTSSAQNYIIKFLMDKIKCALKTCVIVLHGALDTLATPNFTITQHSAIESLKHKSLFAKILACNIRDLPKKVFSKVTFYAKKISRHLAINIDLKKSILYKNSQSIKYIALAQHIQDNLGQYIDTTNIQVHVLTLPAVFACPCAAAPNQFLKIAVFGYGHSAMLYRLNVALAKCDIQKDYEIRIIGMDGSATEDFPHVTHPIRRVLKRTEMEALASDIDMFLILYEKERYILSCSGSIIEAHSYVKPVLYLDNPCINAFNPPENPVGIACANIDEMATTLTEIINNFEEFRPTLQKFKSNMLAQRDKIDIRNNLETLRAIVG
ncbi:hypothetical protein [uncultured Desulfovibrio sp.]|uniref:hypothetical protein n=1 Tax=uncultured Desulfovibrio sp. TaxID=167968 RepID=UPI00265DB8E9|nr:hypothetical protein [uncultured Desulfovibrio sp.]